MKWLNNKGSFYLSFKLDDFSEVRNGWFFNDMTNESFKEFIKDIPQMMIVEQKISVDVRPVRENEKWINIIMIKN